MSVAALTYTALAVNGSAADPAGTAVTSGAGNGATLTQSAPEQTLFRVVNGSTAGNVTLKAGAQPLAIASGQGDLTVAVGASATVWLGPVESGRFLQADGSLSLSVDQAMTVTAFKVARH